jgi:hypothetical protein
MRVAPGVLQSDEAKSKLQVQCDDEVADENEAGGKPKKDG